MKTKARMSWLYATSLLFCLVGYLPLKAQLNTIFQEKFDEILVDAFLQSGSPGEHGSHFIEAAMKAANELTPALNSFIAGNISSFPLSSTSAGVTFDFSTGQPVSISESLGPIFAETAKTLGKGKINFGFNYTLLSPSRIRGINTNEMQFSFTHLDVDQKPGEFLGTNPNESDVLDVGLGLNLDASIFAFYLTAGITNNLDIGLAIPLVNLTMEGEMIAEMNSFTWAALGQANHRFGGTNTDPELRYTTDYSDNAAGIGDLAVRLKYSFLQGAGSNLAVLIDARVPTGDQDNFLGTGKTNVRFSGIVSQKIGDFTPHLNIGYDLRTADLDSDELEFAVGFDQKLAPGLTFAFDILGEIDLNDSEQIGLFPGTTTIRDQILSPTGTPVGSIFREISNSNIPDDIKDNVINTAAGFRYAPSDRVQFLANVLVPLNNGGLRSNLAATLGMSISL